MEATAKRLPAVFYRSAAVREWLLELSREDRRILGEDIKDVEFSWLIGMPLCRNLGNGLWEVRSDLAGGRTARVLFCVDDGKMVLFHGFMKKTQKTPVVEIEKARSRMRDRA